LRALGRSRTALSISAMRALLAHRDAGLAHVRLGLADGELAEMEDRGGEHSGSVTLAHAVDQIVEAADAARGDHRHADRVGDRAGERVVEALARAVAIDSRQQDLARTQFYQALRPPDRVEPG